MNHMNDIQLPEDVREAIATANELAWEATENPKFDRGKLLKVSYDLIDLLRREATAHQLLLKLVSHRAATGDRTNE